MKSFPFPKTAFLLSTFQRTEKSYKDLVSTFAKECLLYSGQEPIVAPTTIEFLLNEDPSDLFTWYYTLSHQYTYYSKHKTLDVHDLIFITLMDIIRYPEEYEGALEMVSAKVSLTV